MIQDELRLAMIDIKEAQEQLLELLRTYHVTECCHFSLPAIAKKEETSRPDFIEVTVAQGMVAQSKIKEAWFRYYGEDGCSTKAAYREPGAYVIVVSKEERQAVRDVVACVNRAKSAFLTMAHQIENEDERFEIVHDLFPMLLINNLRRDITIHEDPKSLRFGWANKPLIFKRTKKAIMDKLDKSQRRNHKLLGDADDTWVHQIENEIETLSRIPEDAELREIRDVRVSPSVNIDKKVYACPIPVLVLVEKRKKPFIKLLENYDKLKSKPRGRKPVERQLVNARLHIYQLLM